MFPALQRAERWAPYRYLLSLLQSFVKQLAFPTRRNRVFMIYVMLKPFKMYTFQWSNRNATVWLQHVNLVVWPYISFFLSNILHHKNHIRNKCNVVSVVTHTQHCCPFTSNSVRKVRKVWTMRECSAMLRNKNTRANFFHVMRLQKFPAFGNLRFKW